MPSLLVSRKQSNKPLTLDVNKKQDAPRPSFAVVRYRIACGELREPQKSSACTGPESQTSPANPCKYRIGKALSQALSQGLRKSPTALPLGDPREPTPCQQHRSSRSVHNRTLLLKKLRSKDTTPFMSGHRSTSTDKAHRIFVEFSLPL